jgi:hypothetical protein
MPRAAESFRVSLVPLAWPAGLVHNDRLRNRHLEMSGRGLASVLLILPQGRGIAREARGRGPPMRCPQQ